MKKEGRTEDQDYPLVFVCTFCRQEFESINSVFSHMSEMHNSDLEEFIDE